MHSSAQDFEREWWGSATNTFGEEAKQLTYATKMGLVNEPRDGKWPVYDLQGRSVVEIGGGPTAILLKTVNGGRLTVVDPCPYPDWVRARYEAAGIEWVQEPGETWRAEGRYDEAWVCNCLQHTVSPREVIRTARDSADVLRIFEWVEMETDQGHPHTLHADELNDWIGATGTVGQVDENGAVGLAYWGCM